MAENSKIEWTTHTFNPWHGCVKVSQGCKHCYADAQDRRFGESHWGPSAPRKMMSEAYWRQPERWNRDAAAQGVRARVFCASMADVFEQLPRTHISFRAVEDAQFRLWKLITATSHLDWLLLTKRPENVSRMVPGSWMFAGFPPNVWLGTSVEDQAAADERIPHLLQAPARVRFLSCEPLLGPVDLTRIGKCDSAVGCRTVTLDSLAGGYWEAFTGTDQWTQRSLGPAVSWVIVGGESGPGARPMHPDWARSLRDQCQAADVPFFFKQFGNWLPLTADETCRYPKAPFYEWPDDHLFAANVGKHAAGRVLDGRTWDEMPLGTMPAQAGGLLP